MKAFHANSREIIHLTAYFTRVSRKVCHMNSKGIYCESQLSLYLSVNWNSTKDALVFKMMLQEILSTWYWLITLYLSWPVELNSINQLFYSLIKNVSVWDWNPNHVQIIIFLQQEIDHFWKIVLPLVFRTRSTMADEGH